MSTPPQTPKPTISVASAPSAKPLTAEERQQRLIALRKRMGKSQIEVTPPAGKTGLWAPKDDTRELSRLQWVGYSIVHDDPAKPAWQASGQQADGTYVIGDVILMEIDTEIYDLLQEEYRQQNIDQRTNAPAAFIADAEKEGVPAFEISKPRR
jgi:hypothetical protein